MTPQGKILFEALVSCGDDAEDEDGIERTGQGLYLLINTQPLSVIVDKLSQKLEDNNYLIVKTGSGEVLEFQKTGENKNGK